MQRTPVGEGRLRKERDPSEGLGGLGAQSAGSCEEGNMRS